MEQKPAEERKKSKQGTTKVKTNDSSYGSMITGTSSCSSLSLSLFSESDLQEAPSTSGCSSEMATVMQSRERRKEKAKEFMKKLKSMLPKQERIGKMDTLSTLEKLVNSMRQLNEEHKQDNEFKPPPPHNTTYHGSASAMPTQSDMSIIVSPKNHVVQSASPSLMEHLGYPADWWKGRLLKDFLHKKDPNTVNSCIALHSTDEEHADTVESPESSNAKGDTKYFYARIRRFRKLGSGFNLQNVVSYCPFLMKISHTKVTDPMAMDEEEGRQRKSIVVHCHPLQTAHTDDGQLPEERKFSLRHSPFCKYTYAHPNAIQLLGFLPQDFNGMSIFELYHPDDYQQLLEIHKKIVLSMGQPFKSNRIRLRTRNGSYIEVETEWSSFINPWSMRLEFIIGQHTLTKPPCRIDVFEDLPSRMDKPEMSPNLRKMQDKILEVLKKPVQGFFAEPAPLTSTRTSVTTSVPKAPSTLSTPTREADSQSKKSSDKPKVHFQVQAEAASTESKSAVIDDKGISSIYNQLNYSRNIKRFLMSHPKSFSNVSDEDSMLTRDDSEDDVINDEEEMPLEIPVVKPPSCGSSTQVHVSEQGHGEEMLSPPTFGDEAMPRQESADNIHLLTEESLKKHTKIQERLYLQRLSEEQPLLLNMRRVKNSRNTLHQKRPRPLETDEEMDTAKHPCTNSGIFRSSSNIFMQSFPPVTTSEMTVTSTSSQVFHQSNTGFMDPQAPQLGMFPTRFPTESQPNLAISAQPITLVSGDPVRLPYIPTSIGAMIPSTGLIDITATTQPQNIQWPYYPQTGYTLLPQVMAGFYRPVLQPVALAQPQTAVNPTIPGMSVIPEPLAKKDTEAEKVQKPKTERFNKYKPESENPTSSVEDTTSSIMFLLEGDSSMCEDSDNKASILQGSPRVHKKRSLEPPWLRGVKWNTDKQMRYQVPARKLYQTLKSDKQMLMKSQQAEAVNTCLEQLLEDISLPDHEDPMDEEADYIFYPGDKPATVEDEATQDKIALIDMTSNAIEAEDGGGGVEDDGGGGQDNLLWELREVEHDEDYDSPINSHCGDEKVDLAPVMEHMEDGVDKQMEDSKRQNMDEINKIPIEAIHKEGSLSGDDGSGSDGGQKHEMEDSQSNCSKDSSDLTPSDNRSNEEVGSSMKESDASVKNSKSLLSIASNSSNEHSSPEDGLPTRTVDCDESFKKLFVPLKVWVNHRSGKPGIPHWLLNTHLSHKMAMTYKVPSRILEDVLSEDKKKMNHWVQSSTVKQQLLQLLSEVDPVATTPQTANSASKAMSAPTATTTSRESGRYPSMDSSVTSLSNAKLERHKNEIPASTLCQPVNRKESVFACKTLCDNVEKNISSKSEVSSSSSQVPSDNPDSSTMSIEEKSTSSDSDSKDHLSKNKTFFSMPSTMPMESHVGEHLTSSRHLEASSSDTNTDPIADDCLTQSSGMGSSSGLAMSGTEMPPTPLPQKPLEMNFQDHMQALIRSESDQKIEDIIMSKVFLPGDYSNSGT